MINTLLQDENNQFLVIEDPSNISEILRERNRLLWIDLDRPSMDEIRLIRDEFDLHPLAVEDALMHHQRPKVDQYEDFYLVVFYSVALAEPGQAPATPGRRGLRGTRFLRPGGAEHVDFLYGGEAPEGDGAKVDLPVLANDGQQAGETSAESILLRELTLFMGENYLITVHNHPVPELQEAARRWRRNVELIVPAVAEEANNHLPGTRPLTPQERGYEEAPARKPGHAHTAIPVHDAGPGEQSAVEAGAKQAPRAPSGQTGGSGESDIGILLYSLLDTVVDNYFPVIDSLVERVEDLEQQIFERFNQGAIEGIFVLKKDLLALRKVLAPERDVLNVLTRRDIPIFQPHTLVYFQDIYDHVVRITDSIDTYRDLLSSALDSYLSMQSNRLNITVQTLTSLSIILMSIAAITGWYGMNFENMSELQWGYPGIFVVALVVVGVEYIIFKRRGWL